MIFDQMKCVYNILILILISKNVTEGSNFVLEDGCCRIKVRLNPYGTSDFVEKKEKDLILCTKVRDLSEYLITSLPMVKTVVMAPCHTCCYQIALDFET